MMDSRRDFLKKAAMLSGSVGFASVFPPSIQKALSIEPAPGSSFYDAEHVVLLMQENRSFDHCFGSLRGVRGFNDPRAVRLPNDNPVWLQTNAEGKTFVPFRLNIKDTKATWTGDLPHAWEDQTDANNNGRHDQWLHAKVPHKKEFRDIPLTMGYYNREDIPFYYALADAFTVFDQHFCSSLTGTTTNRLFFWTGTHKASAEDVSHVRNSEVNFDHEAGWATFPERLEEAGVSWKVYQNEVSITNELHGEANSLLGNFADNNLEWFKQYHVRFCESHRRYLRNRQPVLEQEINALKKQVAAASSPALREELEKKEAALKKVAEELVTWSEENFSKLSPLEQSLHHRAFVTNIDDPDYHSIEELTYEEDGETRTVSVPKGDILHQFRKDVESGELPAVSWVVAPGKFSDHPSAPWYGAWYVSEVLDILTKNPEIWKKTIFVLTYDENDGYFDHVPPFLAPDPRVKGAVSAGIDTRTEFVTRDEEINRKGVAPKDAREHAVGLGYRVPMVIASPWTRGGWVNSQVCDITSTIMLMEKWLAQKTGREIVETNISSWRRTICGDLTSAFRSGDQQAFQFDAFLERDAHVKAIYNASFKAAPANFRALTPAEIDQARAGKTALSLLPRQEAGIKSACALPYELYADGSLSGGRFVIDMKCSNQFFADRAVGAPFHIYAANDYREQEGADYMRRANWHYALTAGDALQGSWDIDRFKEGLYHLEVFGPNGFYRVFAGKEADPMLQVTAMYALKKSPKLIIDIKNQSANAVELVVTQSTYNNSRHTYTIGAQQSKTINIETGAAHHWYDVLLTMPQSPGWMRRFAGRIENGLPSKTDPYMGGVLA